MGYFVSCRNTRRSWCRMFPPTSYRTPQDIVFVHAVCKLTSANHAAGTIGGRMAAAADSILNSSPSALALSTLQRAHAAAFIDSHDALGLAITCYPMYLRPINSTGVGGVPFSFTETVEWMRFETEGDYEIYAGKIEAAIFFFSRSCELT